jgi:hypothetical protein
VTNQEAFDTALEGVFRQGCRSNDGLTCQYVGPGGTRCAVGHLLTDAEVETFRGNSLPVYRVLTGLDAPIPVSLSGLGAAFLTCLQNAHDATLDGLSFRNNYLKTMRGVASQYDLSCTKLDALQRELETP